MTPSTNLPGRQRGITVFGGFLLLLVIAAFALIVIRVTPAYIENYNIKRVLGDMAEDSALAAKSPQEIVQSLHDRLRFSGVHELGDKKIKVRREGGKTHVSIDYEVRKPVVGNLAALITFSDKIEIVPR